MWCYWTGWPLGSSQTFSGLSRKHRVQRRILKEYFFFHIEQFRTAQEAPEFSFAFRGRFNKDTINQGQACTFKRQTKPLNPPLFNFHCLQNPNVWLNPTRQVAGGQQCSRFFFFTAGQRLTCVMTPTPSCEVGKQSERSGDEGRDGERKQNGRQGARLGEVIVKCVSCGEAASGCLRRRQNCASKRLQVHCEVGECVSLRTFGLRP